MSFKILVLSDTHGLFRTVDRIVEKHGDADMIFFLGDGAADIKLASRTFPRPVISVRGNCDVYASELPVEQVVNAEGHKFMLCHGHIYNVKNSAEPYLQTAIKKGCDAALFGHTHIPVNEYHDGVYLFNPGSLYSSHTYGLIDIVKSGMSFNIVGEK